ncbi:MAG: nitrite/sulfite reductase [Candidatus Accumulibacter sp.]|jgi:sulfite reductase (NADPH) hemoprotein beta-component|nr:nitrite/sulfite reductase [Accumulibacter sp.]
MYRYDSIDRQIVNARVAQYRDQVARNLAGDLSDEELRPLRLQNGLYIERHGPLLRVGIPYGQLSSAQLRKLADVSRRYDKGYGHFTTRLNMQLNWTKFERTPDILAELATVDMHAIQSSGACIRNISTDKFAGVAPDELADPRPYCEILRQWSTLHPEFAFLPRKFKITVNAADEDRALSRVYDVGLQLLRVPGHGEDEIGFRVFAGGGLGRTPFVSHPVRDFLPRRHLLTYLDALLRVYNRHGRRDKLYKARLKILVNALGAREFARQVEEEWSHLRDGPATLTEEEFARVAAHFAPPPYEPLPAGDPPALTDAVARDEAFAAWMKRNVHAHRMPGYAAVTLSLKAPGKAPGDVTAAQMEAIAGLAERFGFGELRVAREQNLVLPDVRRRDLPELWREARAHGLATANVGLLTDIICCPGGDLCGLAYARSVPIALALHERFADPGRLRDLGEISLNISGCVNSCGHHHVANIGILGVDKNDEEWYQITLGGRHGKDAAIGEVIGPSFAADEVPDVIDALIALYLERRAAGERFVDTLRRLGVEPFRERAYAGRGRGKAAAAKTGAAHV